MGLKGHPGPQGPSGLRLPFNILAEGQVVEVLSVTPNDHRVYFYNVRSLETGETFKVPESVWAPLTPLEVLAHQADGL